MTDTFHEFEELDPTSFHLVPKGATGFPTLIAKAAEGAMGEVLDQTGDLTKARWAGFCGVEACSACQTRFGVMHEQLIAKSKLKAKQRNGLPTSAFALPDQRAYPIHDESHARAALSMLHNASPDEQSKIKAAVHRRYPNIGEGDKVTATKEGTPQASEESFSIPGPSGSEGQGHELHPGAGAVHMDVMPDGSVVIKPPFSGAPAPVANQEGHGYTAPDKTIPTGEALSQTREMTRKAGEGDGRGDPAPNGEADVAAAESEAKTQTDEVSRKLAMTTTDPGSPEWEREDAALAEQAGQLIERLESREKAEEVGGASKGFHPLLTESVRRLVQTGQGFLDNEPTGATKEIDDMTPDELTKMLDERDARREQEKKDLRKAATAKAKEKKAKAKMKAMEDEKEMAEKAAADPEWAAKQQAKKDAKVAKKAAKATSGLTEVTKTLDTLADSLLAVKSTVDAIASQPQSTPLLSDAGIRAVGGVAALRGSTTGTGGAFKELEENVAKALQTGDPTEYANANRELATARMVAFERARAGGRSNEEALALVR